VISPMGSQGPGDDGLVAAKAEIRATRDPAALQAFLVDRSDAEIMDVVMAMGPETFLEPTFAAMADRFQPDRAPGRHAVVQFDIGILERSETWQCVVADGVCRVSRGPADKPTVSVTMAMPAFLRLAAGMVNGVDAFMAGDVKLRGDVMLAQRMLEWFDIPAAP
jgi:putative sterol carrier protein